MRFLSLLLVASGLLAPTALTAPSGLAPGQGAGLPAIRAPPKAPSTPPKKGAPGAPQTPVQQTIGNSNAAAGGPAPGAPAKAKGSDGGATMLERFPIDDYVKNWLEADKNKEKIAYAAAYTTGGWEGWAQFTLEFAIREQMGIALNKQVREVTVYESTGKGGKQKAADFTFSTLDPTKQKGMVVELKCETKNAGDFVKLVKADVEKLKGKFKPEYEGFDKVVLAMAYTETSKKAFKGMGFSMLEGTRIELQGMPESLGIYRWDLEQTKKLDTSHAVDDLAGGVSRLDIQGPGH